MRILLASFRHLLTVAALAAAPLAHAVVFPQLVFSDDFNGAASPLWGNQSGNWYASSGVYDAADPFAVNYSGLPFNVTDFAIDVDINHVADGGIWLRTDGTDQNGILLVTGGDGWYWGSRTGQAGRALYFHRVINGSYSPYLAEIMNVFTPEVDSPHVRVEVAGNTYSVFLNGAATPITALTDSTFAAGFVGLYDASNQTFDNFLLQVPEPSTFGLLGVGVGLFFLRIRHAQRIL